ISAALVAAADTLSAMRPDAGSESLDNFLALLHKLEEITNMFGGVEKSYDIEAGREVREIVITEQIDDTKIDQVSGDVRHQSEETLNYPGTIKVTVIRETRAIEIAK